MSIVQSCRKDDCDKQTVITASYDSIRPHDYFPAYPGSWWEYDNSERIETKADWQLFSYRIYTHDNCGSYSTDSIYLPVVIDEKESFLYYDRFISQDKYCFKNHSVHILFSEGGNRWESWYDPQFCFHTKAGHTELVYTKERNKVGELDAMTINGELFNDIIIIKEEDRHGGHLSFTKNLLLCQKRWNNQRNS